MPGLNRFTSNRIEVLSAALTGVIRDPLADPFAPEIIVVHSPGMERWISMEIAKSFGVCANVRFPFPNQFVYENLFRKILGNMPDPLPLDRDTMAWKILGLLDGLSHRPEFEVVRHFLKDSDNDLKRFQLADRIAHTFDQYLLFRPEMILGWQAGKEDHWQAVLWREAVRGDEENHGAALRRRFFKALDPGPPPAGTLPERVGLFGISTLPPFHLEVLEAVSEHCQVNLFCLNPCREYWGVILSGREMGRIERRSKGTAREGLYLDQGNPLLASMGTLGRDFFDRIEGKYTGGGEFFIDPAEEEETLLAVIQSDILNLLDRGGPEDPSRQVEPEDDSIRIHVCHGPMREIEVLHDRLLDLFQHHPDLRPADILVMTPEIETYASYIQAVFDRPATDSRRIPFSIADRSCPSESRLIEGFLRILDLWGGRHTAAEVLSILESPSVAARFDLAEPDLDRVRKWVRETRIRWGIDEEDRGRHRLPRYPENTWRAGLDRLLLGYALPGGGERMFGGILPYDAMEGEESDALGRFLDYCRALFGHVNRFDRNRSPDGWSGALLEMADDLFAPGEEAEADIRTLRETIGTLGSGAVRAGFEGEVDFPAVRSHLRKRLSDQGFGYGFITGGVTFCAMLPMRSIPFKVICMVGMNGDQYPRRDAAPGFDLMAGSPRAGDRSPRNDDRYLFLESILSARERLHISYVGQSIRDNSPIPPSVLVSELLDVVEKGFTLEGGESVKERVVVHHRLQAFSPAYFGDSDDPRLFSYSEENLLTARRMVSPRQAPAPFFQEALPEPEAELRTLSLDDLAAFLCNPAKFLLNRRLKIHLDDDDDSLEESEPFALTPLDRYNMGARLVGASLEGSDGESRLDLERACGRLPHGTPGACDFADLCRKTDAFAEALVPRTQHGRLAPLPVDLTIDGFRLHGRLTEIHPDHLLRFRFATVKAKDRIRIWIRHLTLNAVAPKGYPRTSLLFARGGESLVGWEYGEVDDPKGLLAELLSLYWKGLRRPLPFFPESGWIYAEAVHRNGTKPEKALSAASHNWHPDEHRGWAESDDPYFTRCFGPSHPLDEAFQNLSSDVYKPLIETEQPLDGP